MALDHNRSAGNGGRTGKPWRSLAAVAVLLLTFLIFQPWADAGAEPIVGSRIRVIDGDTIRVDRARPDVRLVPFNAPETRRPKCEAERDLGGKATRRLRDLVAAGGLELEYVRCACAPGTEGTMRCNYGRKCGVLKSNGKNVGEILIAEKLAVRFECGETRCPKMPAPWCD